MNTQNNRWYDEHKDLANFLELFKDMKDDVRDKHISAVISLIKQLDPDALSFDKAFNFPLDIKRRRWYDSDPYLWLVINTLELVNQAVLDAVIDYLKNNIKK
jgi:hypothetical protein